MNKKTIAIIIALVAVIIVLGAVLVRDVVLDSPLLTNRLDDYQERQSQNPNEYSMQQDSNSQPQNGNQQGAPDQPQISREKAEEIALVSVGGGIVSDIELDYENGKLVYSMEVIHEFKEYDLDIDAMTGEVLKLTID